MDNQILLKLKSKLEDLSSYGEVKVETQRNALKEELQFYVLNYIYHHKEYSKWIMYGGSALRICHKLNRMSVDLDFEVPHSITENFLEELKKEIELYFADNYGVEVDFLSVKITKGRGLLLKFHIGKELGIKHPSRQVHVKIDLNHFVALKTVSERIPINHDQFSFVILTYNMSALMASKIAAIFLRGTRGVGKAVYEEKGRDIYDLLWYMERKIVPDLDYLLAKNIDIKDLRALFDKITLQMNKESNENLRNDLSPLFVDQTFIKNWLENWLESYLRLLEDYKINTITKLNSIIIHQDFQTDVFSFIYQYETEENKEARIVCNISDLWIEDKNLSIVADEKIRDLIEFNKSGISSIGPMEEKLAQYATLFSQKIEAYFKKTNNIMLGNNIETKLIRMTASNLNQREQVVLNKSALLSCELEDLFK